MKTLRIAGIFGLFAVLLGAFGAHGLREHLSESSMKVYQTGVQYHFWHALALMGLGLFENQSGITLRWTKSFFTLGIILFSGSLYLLAITEIRWLGMITPIGGVSLILGWFRFTLDSRNPNQR